MPRPPARAVIASTLSAATLLAASACLAGDPGRAARADRSAAATDSSRSPAAGAPALTEAQAQAALIGEADLGEPWTATQGAATWRDGMLKATSETADCGRLIDALYAEELLGGDARTLAAAGLDDTGDEAQLRQQIVAQRPADVDRTLAWLRELPQKCGTFAATTAHGAQESVRVEEAELPDVGDARQALHIVFDIPSDYDEPITLTLDVAAVRAGDDAMVVTNGGLGDVSTDATRAAVEVGVHRLTEVRKQGRVEI
jgi:hypothetical protein